MLGRKQSIKIADSNLFDSIVGSGGGGGGASSTNVAAGPSFGSPPGASGDTSTLAGAVDGGLIGGVSHMGGANAGGFGVSLGGTAGATGANRGGSRAWFNKTYVRHSMRVCSVLSLLSCCANTSRTFASYPKLLLITFAIDIVTGAVFTIEMAFKIYTRGFLRGAHPYAKDRWCQFDATMVLFIWISVLLQIFEIFHIVQAYSVFSVLRSPRPLILIRFIRVFLKFSMPKSRIKQIFKRSSQQIYNVTLFFLFFMLLFGLLGVQLFGQIEKHCVVKGTARNNITINSLAIPDTHCSGHKEYGNQCPDGMECIELHLPKEVVGYNGFDHIGHSLYIVYQTSSQEGWSHLMYSTFDHYPAWKVAAYFVSLIFFIGWLVRNVFIAVFTETFNEIRVQFQQMWGERQSLASEGVPKVLKGDDRGWKLVEVDESQSQSRWVPQAAKNFLNSAKFQVIVFLAIMCNVSMSASIVFEHDGRPREVFYEHIYWYEVGFTIFFNIEALFKISCLGFHCYWTRTSHRFEFCLALGCTIHIIPPFFMTELADFQVFRVIRLIKASPVLEDFAYKSFGPGRKLGSLVIFTVCLLVVTSAMTMQLFCMLHGYHRFQDFPYAFMSMFQILTQEAWTDIMNETMLRVKDQIGPYVAIYFIMYHLFVSLIVLSLFVAVILDNLELPEDLKKAKQEKARDNIAYISEELPLRLRLFERFPDSPQMTKLHKSASEFSVPKVRESFMRSFVDDIDNHSTIKNCIRAGMVLAPGGDTSAVAAPIGARARGLRGSTSGSKRASQRLRMNLQSKSGSKQQQQLLHQQQQQQQQQHHLQRQQVYRRKQHSQRSNVTKDSKDTADGDKRLPALKLLSQRAKTSSTNKMLRKTAIHQLIAESNLQRMSLMNEDASAVAAVAGAGANSKGGSLAAGNQAKFGPSGQLRMRGERAGSLTAKLQQSSYDYLKENGEGMQENLRNPQDLNIKMLKRKRQQAELKRSQREKDLRENHPLFDTPLFIVGRESRFRKFCQLLAWAQYQYNDRDLITGKNRKSNYKTVHNLLGLVCYLDWIMIIITSLSCISMCFETPESRLMNTPALQIAEYVFVASMTIELSLKTLANGLLFTPKAILSTTAGCMDAFIFITSLTYMLWMPQDVEPQSFAQYLMLLRCVRPLRIFSLIPHMRKVIYELVRGFKAIFLVCVLLGLLCFVFACYGVHIFGGRLARCTDPTVTTRENCTGVFLRKVFVTKMRLTTDDSSYPAMLVNRVWANPHRFSFDSIRSAMLALFEVLSFKGWVDIREALLKRFDNSLHTLYIHIFVFFGCMVGVTLFVGVVIANYGENKGTALLTVDQRRWCDLKKRLKIAQPLHLPPRPDHIKFRAIIYDIIQNIYFKRLVAMLVLANSSLLMFHWDPNGYHIVEYATVSAGLTLAFFIEVIMKMIAFTPRGYWQSRRNRYDLVVTFIGCIWVIVHFAVPSDLSNTFGFIVVILRFFTITGKHATLQMLMLTVVVSVYKSFFIILGLFVLVLFYSLLGVQLFGSVKFGENLSRQANFKSAKLGTITMFRIVTGEDWYRMMHDCMIQPPYCTKGRNIWETDCGNFGLSFAFFSSFYIIITHMVLNLLVAIIMENFSLFYSSEEDALLSYTDIRNFQNTWNVVDAQQKGTIPVRRVKFILRLLKGRLEVDPTRDQHLIKHMCHEMERLHNGEDVSFHDVLSMLSYRSVDINKSLQFEELLARNELESVIEEEVAKKTIRQWLDQCLRRVKKQRQESSKALIAGLRQTNMGGTDLFSAGPPSPGPTTGGAGTGAAATASGHTAAESAATGGAPFASAFAAIATAAANASDHSGGDAGDSATHGRGGTSLGIGNQRHGAAGPTSSSSDLSPQTPLAVGPSHSMFDGSTTKQPAESSSSSCTTAVTAIQAAGGHMPPARMPSSSTSESQHSASSTATMATLAASLSKLKRRAEAAHSDSASTGATGGSGAQRKLFAPVDPKKDERQQHLRRAIKAFTNPTGKMSLANKTLDSSATGQSSLDEESNKVKQQNKPKLNAAINDIHVWWDYQFN